MTAGAWVAGAWFAVFAVADWVAVARGARRVEYVLKPAALASLIAVALLLDPADGGSRAWFVVALSASLAGDVFLMLPTDRFVPGLASFLVGHIAYTIGLNLDGGDGGALALAAAGVAVVGAPLGGRIVRGARSHDAVLAVPVALYVLVISAMVVSALATGSPWAIAGAGLFYLSDALIGWTRFVAPIRGDRLGIMVTYHAGQAGLVVWLLS